MDDKRSTPVRDDQAPASPDRRRPYRTAVLTEYGTVANLTQGNVMGSRADAGGMLMYGPCL